MMNGSNMIISEDNQAIVAALQAVNLKPKNIDELQSLPRASVMVPLVFRQNNNNNHNNGYKNVGSENSDSSSPFSLTTPKSSSSSSWHILLTKRAAKLRSNAGEVCFPGGRQDPQDNMDDIVTAKRETFEEIGIPSEYIEPICRLEALESDNHLCCTPVVGVIKDASVIDEHLKINPSEVESAFFVPLDFFADINNNCAFTRDVEWKGQKITLQFYKYNDVDSNQVYTIWGFTAHIARLVANMAIGSGDNTAVKKIDEEKK